MDLKYLEEHLLRLTFWTRIIAPVQLLMPRLHPSFELSLLVQSLFLQGNTDVDEFMGSLPWHFRAGASVRQGHQKIEQEENLGTHEDTQREPGGCEKGWSSFLNISQASGLELREGSKRVLAGSEGIIQSFLSRLSPNQSYMGPSGKAHFRFGAFLQPFLGG